MNLESQPYMKRRRSLLGQSFGRLTVVADAPDVQFPNGQVHRRFVCLCECGNKTIVQYSNLKTGCIQSCGCLHKERTTRHGDHRHYLYQTWVNIKSRCLVPHNPGYRHYGGRGITVFEPWRFSYESFRDYIAANLGDRPDGFSIDRIDNNAGYVPGNLRWADRVTQNNNMRRPTTQIA